MTTSPPLFENDRDPPPEPVVQVIDPPPLPAVPAETFTLVLVPLADPADHPRPVEYRLKMLIKEALRRYGFDLKAVRCPTCEELLHAAEWL